MELRRHKIPTVAEQKKKLKSLRLSGHILVVVRTTTVVVLIPAALLSKKTFTLRAFRQQAEPGMEEEQKNASPSIMENVPLFLSRLELNFEKNRMNYVQIHAKYIPLHTSTVSQKVGHTSRVFVHFSFSTAFPYSSICCWHNLVKKR